MYEFVWQRRSHHIDLAWADIAPSSRDSQAPTEHRRHCSPASASDNLMTQPHRVVPIARSHGTDSQIFQENWCNQHTAAQHTRVATCETDHTELQRSQHALAKHIRSAGEETSP